MTLPKRNDIFVRAMTRLQMYQKSIRAIHANGALLVYPLDNRPEPRSIWSELFPRSQMVWKWDENGDGRVSNLWILREELSRSREVIYAKWYQNRATFFSFEVFLHLLAFFDSAAYSRGLLGASRSVQEILQEDSPLSTKQLKAAADLEGRLLESTYNRALRPLWARLLIVGFGEFQDSSFPSLGIGSTKLLFEELWLKSLQIDPLEAEEFLRKKLGEHNPFFKFANKIKSASR